MPKEAPSVQCSWDHRTIQAGRDRKRSPVQPPGQSKATSGLRPGCSGLYPIRAWKPPRMERTQTFWALVLQRGYPHREEFLLTPCLHLSGFKLCLLPLMLPPHTTVRTLALSPQFIPGVRWGTAHMGLSKAVSSPDNPLLEDPVLSPTTIDFSLLMNSLQFISIFPGLGGEGEQTRCSI